ncbi:DsbA family protein [Rhodobacter capsulatus]|jgi:protein-disulfide isomerase|uniref:DsbA family protein n=1 Tax=Rhodobacter capsulatus TaxID=1061 RepID=UPI0003D35036|nr:DsbA family protein [Rhodobacter capsulatus]ETD01523.1 DSBA oxidoreductase [Rhodobacter capsulatus DE442]ETD76590.1 DSBA oxidoreductase [Rhodobacter capsulatus R121]ETE53426.1 DSBA oxidoreductase [Rhodobacter capsulatus Y262]MDS0927199.1 DsbA family protein [Rhodobacter capsulatus]TQD32684.1 DsbA family protein [Rhodobacter capsulatus]
MKHLSLAALTMAAVLGTPAAALDLSAMSAADKAAFGEAVKAYLMENPEVLVEAINKLEERQQAAQADNDKVLVQTNADDIFHFAGDWVGGNPEGDVTMVEFIDYKCTYCKKAYEVVDEVLKKDGKIRFVVKEFPILSDQSVLAARFAVATRQVAGDAAYEKVHDALMAVRGDITLDSLQRLAEEQKIDAKAVLAQMNSEEVTSVLRANAQLAERMAIAGTPAFVVGGQLLRGYAPAEVMAQIVADERG